MKATKQVQIFRAVSTAIAALMMSGFGSCTMSMSEICSQRIPRIDQRLNDAIAALGPWRNPASDGGVPSELVKDDRESWQLWAQDLLVETQRYIDIAGETPAVRRELSAIANNLVTFHGYAQSGRADSMVRILHTMQKHSAKVKDQVCSK
jgi:hypothetical protein